MARIAMRTRFSAMLGPVAAGGFLACALASALVAGFGAVAMQTGVPGGSLFEIGPQRAEVLAPLLLAAAACGLARASTGSGPGWGWLGLVVASALSVLAVDLFTSVFWLLLAVLIVLARRGGAFGLAGLPAAGLMLVVHQVPAGFGGWVVVAGGIGLVAGGVWAARAGDCAGLSRAIALGFAGLGLLGFGLGGVTAAIPAVMADAVIAVALGLIADHLVAATGTCALDWLGGIARGMPRFAVLALVVLGFSAILPPGPGFAAFALVWAGAVAAGSWFGVIVLALWFGLMGFAALRAIGALCLGRPRSLRAAAAEDAPRAVLIGLALLVAGGVVLSARDWHLVGLAVVMLPIAVVASLGLGRSGAIEVAGYDDGFARPPAWLPFGDPATQITATGFGAALRRQARIGWPQAGIGRAWGWVGTMVARLRR